MSFTRALVAGMSTVVLAAAATLLAVTPAAAAAAAESCHAWRTLKHGASGLHAVVEPGSPWHVRLGTASNGYQLFETCYEGFDYGKVKISIRSNAHRYLTERDNRWVAADGEYPVTRDYWFVCALDATWVEISFWSNTHYLGRDASGYLSTHNNTPNGDILWHRSEFADYALTNC